MTIIFNYDANKTHFHNKGFALSLVLKWDFWNSEIAYLTKTKEMFNLFQLTRGCIFSKKR